MTCCIQAWEEGSDRGRGLREKSESTRAVQGSMLLGRVGGGREGEQGAKPLRGSARCKDASEPVLHISELWERISSLSTHSV